MVKVKDRQNQLLHISVLLGVIYFLSGANGLHNTQAQLNTSAASEGIHFRPKCVEGLSIYISLHANILQTTTTKIYKQSESTPNQAEETD